MVLEKIEENRKSEIARSVIIVHECIAGTIQVDFASVSLAHRGTFINAKVCCLFPYFTNMF